MRREIVEDDMDLLLWPALRHNLSQEIHEVGTGVTGRRFPMNPSCLGVQRGIQRQRAVAVILESMALRAAGRQWQHGVQTIQSLNRSLFIHTKYCRMLRRVQKQPEEIRGPAAEVRITAGQIAFPTMRLYFPFPPNPTHHILSHLFPRGDLAAPPLRG